MLVTLMTINSHRACRWWQEGIESQAVDRVNRIGQKKPVHVYQLIADDTVESKVLDIQEKKKTLIKQVYIYFPLCDQVTLILSKAFSGIKGKETQRQQREARLQGGSDQAQTILES